MLDDVEGGDGNLDDALVSMKLAKKNCPTEIQFEEIVIEMENARDEIKKVMSRIAGGKV